MFHREVTEMSSLNSKDDEPLDDKLKIISWNINGIRSTKSTLKNILTSLDADIVCFQETKITRNLIDEDTTLVDGYNSYFSFSKKRSGYSGVATYCRNRVCPVGAEEGLSSWATKSSSGDNIGSYGAIPESFDLATCQSLDSEGRAILTQHKIRLSGDAEEVITLINVYCPRADPDNPERLNFKINFYQLLEERANAILQSGSHVIIVGDINTSHKPIDHCEPCEPSKFESNPGRKWLNQFLRQPDKNDGSGFVDTFRHFHPDKQEAFTCWSTVTGARQTNYGTRIDYAFANQELVNRAMIDSVILPHVEGSDHCPIMVTLKGKPSISSRAPPSICSKYWPEFAGMQTKLSAFIRTSARPEVAAAIQQSSSKEESTSGQAKIGRGATSGLKRKRQTTMAAFLNRKELHQVTAVDNSTAVGDRTDTESESVIVSCSGAVDVSRSRQEQSTIQAWKSLLSGPKPPPLCRNHHEPCILKVVKKSGPTFNKRFYVCARPEGHSSNPNTRCNFFQWLN